MRIAFFGGSFDPPHRGHLRIALTARERLGIDEVLLAPVGRQPLKSHEPAAFGDRLRMVELMCAPYRELVASAVDAPRPQGGEPNYTVATLARLRQSQPAEVELFMLAGGDSFLTLPHWREPEALLRPAEAGGLLAGWILAARPGFGLDALGSALPGGYVLGPREEMAGPVIRQALLDAQGAPATPLYLLPDLDDPSTATRIRNELARGAETPELLPEVAGYVRNHRLYRVLGCPEARAATSRD